VSEFGLHSSKEGPAAFPLPRLVALVEVGTHVVPRPVIGALAQAEVALAEELLPTLTKEMLLIEDRGFVGYEWWARVKSTGADILCRVRNNMRFPRGKRLADGSCISYLPPPKGVDGEKTPVRVIEYALKAVPGSEASYRIITTILDQETAPARELAALYHERWEAQSLFDEFKTHMRGGSLFPHGSCHDGTGRSLTRCWRNGSCQAEADKPDQRHQLSRCRGCDMSLSKQ